MAFVFRVIKRDGSIASFDINRIIQAIMKAQDEVGESDFQTALEIANGIQFNLGKEEVSIEEIQKIIEDELMIKQPNVARAYIAYRSMRDKFRDKSSKLTKDINGLLSLDNKEVANENANKDAKVFPVQRDLIAGIVSKHFGRTHLLPPHIITAHDDGDIHFHDMDYSPFMPMTNCCLVNLKELLSNGFKMGNATIESPKSFSVACAIMAQITAQVASHQYGGTTFANVDQVLEPYAQLSWNKHKKIADELGLEPELAERYADKMAEKEIYDGIQGYEYEVNTLFTTNGQTPFVTVSFGMGTGKYSRWIQESILKVRIKGLGKDGITAVFPKLVMFLDEGINLKPKDPNYDIKQLALKCASKRLYPDIISAKNNRKITGSSVPVSPMGCRSFLGVWKDDAGNEVLDGRNNLGVVSLNLPRIAIEAEGDFTKFWNILDSKLNICKDALDARINSLRGVKASVAPILYTEGAFGVRMKPEDEVLDLFKHGRASISLGYIGVHETLLLMFGRHPALSDEAQDFGRKVIQKLRDATNQWKTESSEGWGYSLYSTPSESLCDRFCRLDAKKFGIIVGVTDKGWYTNSFHLDVDKKVNPFEKIDFEAKYHEIASGGHISYAEFPNMHNNLKGLEAVWDYAIEHLDYFGTNTPSDKCFKCGFEGEFHIDSDGFHCPKCDNRDSSSMNVIRRVCGYLGNPNSRGFNHGKNREVQHRVKHTEG